MFEWQSMLARERMLGLRTEEKPWGLVYPVIFSDGEHFHPDACVTQARKDLSPWAIPHKVFERSVEYVEFHRHMGRIAVELAQLIHDVPQWDPEFPVIQEPDISPAVIAHIPRVL